MMEHPSIMSPDKFCLKNCNPAGLKLTTLALAMTLADVSDNAMRVAGLVSMLAGTLLLYLIR